MRDYLGNTIPLSNRIEVCRECGLPTHRAGRGDDSLYDTNGDGPYCQQCFDASPSKPIMDFDPIPVTDEGKQRIVEAMIHAEIDNLGDMRKAV